MEILKEIANKVIEGKAQEVEELVKRALEDGVEVSSILNDGLIAGMQVVGEKFKKDEFYVPEVLIAARAMHKGMNVLKPYLERSGVKPIAKYVIGTVRGDLHDIGKNLVAMMLRGAGFEVIDLGVDVPPERFVEAVKQNNPDIVGMSALLTTTMMEMKKVIDALKEAGLRDKVKIIIGGAPITPEFAEEIGADAASRDAVEAASICKSWVERKRGI